MVSSIDYVLYEGYCNTCTPSPVHFYCQHLTPTKIILALIDWVNNLLWLGVSVKTNEDFDVSSNIASLASKTQT